MKRILLTYFALLAVGFAADSSRLEQANQRFQNGDIAGAAKIYQEMIDAGNVNATVLYNLGNCEQRLKHHGKAILHYERARLLAPRDPDLRANLELARKAAAVFEEPARYPWVQACAEFLSLNEWSWLVAGGAVFLGGLALLRGGIRFSRKWTSVVRIAAGVAVFAIILGSGMIYQRRGDRTKAVVVADNAAVRLSPFEKADSLGTAGAGRIVNVLKSDGGFHYVQVPGTELRGWMSDKDAVPIMR